MNFIYRNCSVRCSGFGVGFNTLFSVCVFLIKKFVANFKLVPPYKPGDDYLFSIKRGWGMYKK